MRVLIGASTAGKTTLIKYLRNTYKLEVLEIDEVLNRLNGGTFPNNAEYRKNVLVPAIKKDILNRDSTLFFTTTRYFTPDELEDARKKDFKIVQLVVTREEMIRRNKQRIEQEEYNDHSPWFDEMLNFQEEIHDKGLVDTTIDATKPTEEIADELLSFLNR